MIYINNLKENLKLFEALASPIRLQIIELLHHGNEMNINELAKSLNLTNSALTMHIQKLSNCGLIRVKLSSVMRGTQKLCSLTDDRILIELVDKEGAGNFYETELDVGQYADYSINPTCGMSDRNALLGPLDDPQVFSYPERFHANIIWYTDGYVSYRFPNKLLPTQIPQELQISLEISGEAPGAVENFPSEIQLIVNDMLLGVYSCPGELFDRKGRYTPDWYNVNFGQYGRYKVLSVNREGTFLDGLAIGNTTIEQLNLSHHNDIVFKLDCRSQTEKNGGVTLFGKEFGDYNQGVKMRMFYKEMK